MALVEFDSEENVRSLRASVSHKGLVRRSLKIGIVEVDVRVSMSRRRQIHESPAVANQPSNPVDEDKVAQMVGSELCLETVGRVAERCSHNARVGDNDVEQLTLCKELIRRSAHALEITKIKLNLLEASAVCCSVLAHLRGRALRFRQIT